MDLLEETILPGKGRGLCAVTDIKTSELLIEERPDCFVVGNNDCCDHCGRWTRRASDALQLGLGGDPKQLVPNALAAASIESHPSAASECCCCGRRWCSEACRIAGAASHAFLCATGVVDLPLWIAPGHFRLYVVAIAKVVADAIAAARADGERSDSCFLDSYCSPSSALEAKPAVERGFLSAVSQSVDGLRDIFERRLASHHSTLERAFAAPMVARWLEPRGYLRFHRVARANGQEVHVPSPVPGLLSRMLKAAPESPAVRACVQAYLKLHYDESRTHGFPLGRLGGSGQALFKTHSKLNHSCAPNAVVVQTGVDASVVVRAAQPVPAGAEVCICYVDQPEVKLESRIGHGTGARRQELLERYAFWCHCPICIAADGGAASCEAGRPQLDLEVPPPSVAKIALAQCSLPEDEEDDARLHAALAKLGVEVSTPQWADATHDWTQYALVVPRMTWDYQEHPAAFSAWMATVQLRAYAGLDPSTSGLPPALFPCLLLTKRSLD